MKTPLLLSLVLLIGLTCTVASAQDVYVNSSPSANFSQYHTYAWGQQQNPNQIANSFLAQEAKTQINTQLQSKGLKLVEESENPDLIVVGSGGMKTTLNQKNSQKNMQLVDKAVAKMFKKYPS